MAAAAEVSASRRCRTGIERGVLPRFIYTLAAMRVGVENAHTTKQRQTRGRRAFCFSFSFSDRRRRRRHRYIKIPLSFYSEHPTTAFLAHECELSLLRKFFVDAFDLQHVPQVKVLRRTYTSIRSLIASSEAHPPPFDNLLVSIDLQRHAT